MMSSYNKLLFNKSFINGEWHEASDDNYFSVVNPASELTIIDVADADQQTVQKAIESAEAAFAKWSKTPAKKRAKLLRKWQQLIEENVESLAELLTLEMGKPLQEAKGEILYGNSYIEWFAEEAKRINGDILPSPKGDRRVFTLKQPIGVVAAITPWNFPNAMITRKVAPALAAGCTVIIKPSELTPLSALALADLANQAGFPPGVINVVVGTDSQMIGEQLTSSSKVRKLSFTGSTAVGKKLLHQCANTVKKVSLELGGNAPFIVFDDADLDKVVNGLLACKFRNTGQTCISANRILVHESIHDEFIERINSAVGDLTMGSSETGNHQLGPLIEKKAVDKISNLVEDAINKGATVVRGGQIAQNIGNHFYEPTILTNINLDMDIAHTEIFGPVVAVMKFSDEQTAVKIANDTPYGLAAYFFTESMSRSWKVGEALEYGIVGVNEGSLSNEASPFGGMKESGIGREGSKYGIDEYLELKNLCIGGL